MPRPHRRRRTLMTAAAAVPVLLTLALVTRAAFHRAVDAPPTTMRPPTAASAAADGRGEADDGRPLLGGARPAEPPDFSDPFALPSGFPSRPAAVVPPSALSPARASPPRALVPEPPALSLRGVVGNTALVAGQDDVLYLMSPGEAVGGVRCVSVAPDHVVAEHEGRTFTLHLNPR